MKQCCIPAAHVLPVTLSAMFDERAFDKPDEFIRSAIGITISISVSVVMNAWAGTSAGK